MLERILRTSHIRTWRLRGYDTFSGDWYPLPGVFLSQAQAERAARLYLRELERLQPARLSGGQPGLQDRVYIVHPDGTVQRYLLEASHANHQPGR